ncbi:hypothetical protein CERSUDRAFT_60811 [Gelatoporia subvermispora B]|uniref:Uncharacterized protein n=1 Tax=Ceriporiopsis subvermispora (strain B) TaxID=914234 RepID=M2QFL9_CERS8|nr:hypothetical protein CERSUDRAFT_60811 [Gelatoporia subvermispora B]
MNAGGWWSRPSNWKSNTAIVFGMIFAITYTLASVGAEKEVRPARTLPLVPDGNPVADPPYSLSTSKSTRSALAFITIMMAVRHCTHKYCHLAAASAYYVVFCRKYYTATVLS